MIACIFAYDVTNYDRNLQQLPFCQLRLREHTLKHSAQIVSTKVSLKTTRISDTKRKIRQEVLLINVYVTLTLTIVIDNLQSKIQFDRKILNFGGMF